jgi:hypothetical protein
MGHNKKLHVDIEQKYDLSKLPPDEKEGKWKEFKITGSNISNRSNA